jgi:hypothetical protein
MKKLTHDEFLSKIPEDIIIVGEYENSRQKIQAKCSKCCFSWSPVANSLINGHGCPHCGKEVSKKTKKWNVTNDCFLNKIPFALLSTIEVMDKYSSVHSDVKVRCKICEFCWTSSPYKLYRNYGCVVCAKKYNGIKNRKSHDQFIEEINKVHMGSIEVLGDYKTSKDRIEVKCRQCENVWFPVARRLKHRGCSNCISSKGEKKIECILKENFIHYKSQYSFFDLPRMKFDFAIFTDNGLSHIVEYDGQQHFKPVKAWGGLKRYEKQLENDGVKNKYCKENDIRLVRIPYTKFKEIALEMLL